MSYSEVGAGIDDDLPGEQGEFEMSEDDLIDVNAKPDQKIENKFKLTKQNNIPTLETQRLANKNEIKVNFEYAEPDEVYYHSIK